MSPPNPNGKKYLSKVGKLILDNLLLLRKCDLKIKDVISNNLFKYPHSMTQSKKFFMFIKTGNYKKCRDILEIN
jgi:hypothetical protein